MRSERLQAVLVFGLNGVRLLNKEQVVDHDDKGDDIDGAAAERGKREHGLCNCDDCGNDAELKRAITCEGLLAPLMPATPAARSTTPLATSTTAASIAFDPYADSSLPVAMPAIPMTRLAMPRTKINQGKDFECLASGAHSWSFRCGRGESVAPRLRHIL